MADRDDERLRVRHSGLIGMGGLLFIASKVKSETKSDVGEEEAFPHEPLHCEYRLSSKSSHALVELLAQSKRHSVAVEGVAAPRRRESLSLSLHTLTRSGPAHLPACPCL